MKTSIKNIFQSIWDRNVFFDFQKLSLVYFHRSREMLPTIKKVLATVAPENWTLAHRVAWFLPLPLTRILKNTLKK